MKKTILSVLTLAVFCGFAAFTGDAYGQTAKPQQHKVGLIDMAHVFKEYKKFEALREDLKSEIQKSDQQAQQMAQQAKTLQGQLKEYKEGSPDYVRVEKQILSLSSDFETFRKSAQREFLRKESQIYKTIYLETADAVEKYAKYYKYTLVLRFNRQELEESQNPQEILQRMNRQVVYYTDSDDITTPVLDFLNKSYKPSPGAATPPRTGARPTPGTRRN